MPRQRPKFQTTQVPKSPFIICLQFAIVPYMIPLNSESLHMGGVMIPDPL
jgi:hypothetical protein